MNFAFHYPQVPIGKVWIYRLLFFLCLFVCVFVCTVCMVTDFSTEDKASKVEFCIAVHRRLRQGIANFCELCSPEAQNRPVN